MAIGPPPERALKIIGFAEDLARRFSREKDSLEVLFATFVGLVACRDERLASECLIALECALTANDLDKMIAKP
jgi:hypothetical protein